MPSRRFSSRAVQRGVSCSSRERDAGRVELFALAAVGLVRDRGAEHPVRDVLAVDARRERRLEPGDLLRLGARQVAEVALAGEAPELGLAVASCAGRLGQPGRGLERRQVGETLVDRLELEALLQARIVEVVLLVEGGDEPVRLVPVCLEASRRGRRHGSRRIPARAGDPADDGAQDAAPRHHRGRARGARFRRRGERRSRLRPAHHGGRGHQREDRSRPAQRLRDGARGHRRRRLVVEARGRRRAECPVARAGVRRRAAGARAR